jgi:hypothetical protein
MLCPQQTRAWFQDSHWLYTQNNPSAPAAIPQQTLVLLLVLLWSAQNLLGSCSP